MYPTKLKVELEDIETVVQLITILVCLGGITIAWEIPLLISIQVESSCEFLKYLNSLLPDNIN